MVLAVLIAFAAALVAPYVHRLTGDWAGWVLGSVPAALFAYFLLQVPAVIEHGVLFESQAWVPSLGVEFGFALDGLALLFALLITGFGALITVYAGSYLHGDPLRGRFFLYLLAFMASMLGLVLADDIIVLFVFWELTSFTSYLLIGYKHQYEDSRKSALQALLVTGVGGLALLVGLLLMSMMAGGTLSLAGMAEQREAILGHALYLPAFILVALGCFTKSAQLPFHFWLPNAMAAPTPVSAYLHSATMVKAGVYLLARLFETLGGTELWFYTLSIVGGLTMVTGAVLALRHSDLKRLLAYTTVSALGTLVLLLGVGGAPGGELLEERFFLPAVKAAIVFLLTHALYKAALFLVAGSVDHESGTRDVLDLGGLRSKMPWTFAAGILAALSMAGIPLLFGFIGKEMVYKAALALDEGALLVAFTAVFVNVLTVVAAGVVVLRPFFGAATEAARRAHEAPFAMLLGPGLLGLVGLVFGVLPFVPGLTVVGPAIGAVLGVPGFTVELIIWHGLNLALLLSVVTLALGVVGYLKWDPIRRFLISLDPIWLRGPERWYDWGMKGMLDVADWQTRTIQNGNLRHYLITLAMLAFGLVGITYVVMIGHVPLVLPDASFADFVLVGLVIAGAAIAAISTLRLLALAGLGTAGFAIAMIFVQFGAPDVAMTQLLVETLVVIVILMVMRRVPAFERERRPAGAVVRDVAVAGLCGGVLFVVMLAILQVPFDPTLSEYFAEMSWPAAHGRNIVNVILVDFRALDTLGELIVLAAAGLGALVLLKAQRAEPPAQDAEGRP